MKKIFIDSGHGGNDPGAVGNGMREADIVLEVNTLAISNAIGTILERAGLQVKQSRTKDQRPSINDRWRMANEWGADYFFSLHVNAGGGTGAETFIFDGGDENRRSESRAFASAVLDDFCNKMGLRNRGVKPDTRTAVGSLGVLRHTRMPAQLFELPFIDGPADDINALRNRRGEMAEILARGILSYLGIRGQPPNPSPIQMPIACPPPIASIIPSEPPKAACFMRFNIFGRDVEINGNIRDGTTWVHARNAFEEAGFIVSWDEAQNIVVVRKPGEKKTEKWGQGPTWTRPENTVRFDLWGRIVDINGYIRDKITWIQARHAFEEAGFDVSWNGTDETVVIERRLECAEEITALFEIVHWEARGEDERGQRLVANVILNRVNSHRHPNTIKEVIFANGINSQWMRVFQFTPAGRDTFGTAEHSERTIAAVKQAISGVDDSQGATFFHAIRNSRGEFILTPDIWHQRAVRQGTLVHLFDHGNHRFYREAR